MTFLLNIWRRLILLGQRRAVKSEIDEELQFHLEQRTAENLAAGMSPEEAAREARKRFGNLQSVREDCREESGAGWGEGIRQDIRFALRMLRKNPGFTLVAVLTLALGIGANTAIFSLLNTAIVRPLPYEQPDRLLMIRNSYPKLNLPSAVLSPRFYSRCHKDCQSFADTGALTWWSPVLTGQAEPRQVQSAKTTANFLPLLGVAPALGRWFTTAEDAPGGGRVTVLGDGFWRSEFGADPKVIGRKLLLDGESYQIIGVLPPGFKFTQNFDLWVPLAFSPADWQFDGDELLAMGRLKPGATLAQAQTELDLVAKPIREESKFLKDCQWRMLAVPLKEYLVGNIRPLLVLLLAAVSLVLLIACVNVATLLLVAGIGRSKELAIRTALGAARFRLVRQLFVESLVLALLGAGAGLVLAKVLMVWIAGQMPPQLVVGITGWDHVRIDPRVLGYTLAASVSSALIFGLVPALQLSKANVNEPLKEGGARGSAGVRHRRLRSLLVIGEIALATMLLAGAGLVLANFLRALQVDPGFNPDQLLTLRVTLSAGKYPSEVKQRLFFDELLARVGALPGVTSAALVDNPPLWGGTTTTFGVEGREDEVHGWPGAITPGYFDTMKIPMLFGRAFTPQDTAGSLPVAIIDEKLARQLWPNQSPLGKRISLNIGTASDRNAWWKIVGVAGEIKNLGLSNKAKEQYYFPFAQIPAASMCLMVRTAGPPDALIPAVRQQLAAMDPDQPLVYAVRVRDQLDGTLAPQRLAALLVGGFALLALGLAGIGLYGMVAYTTRQRTREFGIRLALGAQRGQLVWLVLRQGMKLVGIGLVIGLPVAYAFGRLLAGWLSEIQPDDWQIQLLAALVLAVVALVACWLPARRAAKVDPMTALRCE